MLYVHLMYKNEHSHENYGLKIPTKIAIERFVKSPSINLINKNVTNSKSFHFSTAEHESIFKKIINLDNRKNGTFKNIPICYLKDVSDMCSPGLANVWNEEILLHKNFPENFKLADVTPTFKKKYKTFVKNYRQTSIPATVSKIFEQIMQKKYWLYWKIYLSISMWIQKTIQYTVFCVSFIERWRLCQDKQGFAGVLLMDLSKALIQQIMNYL